MHFKRIVVAFTLAGAAAAAVVMCRGPGAIVTYTVVTVLGLGSMLEYLRMCEAKGLIASGSDPLARAFKLYGLISCCVFLSVVFITTYPIREVTGRVPRDAGGLEYVTLLLIVVGLFIVQSFESAPRRALGNIAGVLSGIVYVPLLWSFIYKVLYFPGVNGRWYLFALLLVVKGGDMLAYAVGSTLGRHRLIPRISPRKTWEGAAGGLIGALIAGLIIWRWFPCRFSLGGALSLAALLNVLGQVGDLAESMLKRDAAIKDSSAFLPGVGGALDVLDSLLLTAPIVYFYLLFSR